MMKEKRDQGEREYRGKTKITILRYLLDHDIVRFDELNNHLQETLKICNKKTLITHLRDLQQIGIISKKEAWKGNKPYNLYYLEKNLETLKKVYRFPGDFKPKNTTSNVEVEEKDFQVYLMKSKYYTELIESTSFKTELLQNISKSTSKILGKSQVKKQSTAHAKLKNTKSTKLTLKVPTQVLKLSPSALEFTLDYESYENPLLTDLINGQLIHKSNIDSMVLVFRSLLVWDIINNNLLPLTETREIFNHVFTNVEEAL